MSNLMYLKPNNINAIKDTRSVELGTRSKVILIFI